MSCHKPCRYAAVAIAFPVVIAAGTMADHAESTLKYNPGQPGHTNVYDTYINACGSWDALLNCLGSGGTTRRARA